MIDRNHLFQPIKEGSINADIIAKKENRILSSLIVFSIQYHITHVVNGKIQLSSPYINFNKDHFELIASVINKNSSKQGIHIPRSLKGLLDSFIFVSNIVERYRNPGLAIKTKIDSAWNKLLTDKALDYEVRLAETLGRLKELVIPHKIVSPFDEKYYTESGRNAFKNFTRHRFLEVVSQLPRQPKYVLDIGCGYGNYIDAIKQYDPTIDITGIELQEDVVKELQGAYDLTNDHKLHIFNTNIFDFKSQKSFDLVLLNYVLFYFNDQDKKRLLTKVSGMLNERGSILVCQYFPGIEAMKKEIAQHQKEYTISKQIEMYYGNKILYANTLWNDCADTFEQAERWDEFIELLRDCGLKIRSLTHADRFYYSLFIDIVKE